MDKTLQIHSNGFDGQVAKNLNESLITVGEIEGGRIILKGLSLANTGYQALSTGQQIATNISVSGTLTTGLDYLNNGSITPEGVGKNFVYAGLGSVLPTKAQIIVFPTVETIVQNNTSNKGSEKFGEIVGTMGSTVTSSGLNQIMKGNSLGKFVAIEIGSYMVGNKVKDKVTNIIQTPNEPIYKIITPEVQYQLNINDRINDLHKLKINSYNK